jgi:hypothetical protein
MTDEGNQSIPLPQKEDAFKFSNEPKPLKVLKNEKTLRSI